MGPPFFNNGLDPDTIEGAVDLVYALPNMHVEYALRAGEESPLPPRS
jgi:hypothetical protein